MTTSRREGEDGNGHEDHEDREDREDREDGTTDPGEGADRYDGPWKAAIHHYTEAFMALFFPAIHADIDWSELPEFLDQELQSLTPDAAQPAGAVDRLIKLRRARGEEVRVLVHIGVQAQRDQRFMERMFRYHYRIFDWHGQPAVSVAVLADEQPAWRPAGYHHDLWGCDLHLTFPTVKLLEIPWPELEASDNVFAVVVMAHLKTQATRHDPEVRAHWKAWLLVRLYERGLGRDDILNLYRLVDWMMALPVEYEQQVIWNVARVEKERGMPYITSAERLGSLGQARQDVLQALEVRFGAVPEPVRQAVLQVSDLDLLSGLLRRAILVESMVAFEEELGARAGG